MSDIQLYLIEVGKDKDEALRLAQQTALRLERKELKLVALIESIGEYINNDDANLRAQSLAFLADVLTSLQPRTLSLQQRGLLCDFILSRIQDDSEGIGSCARALMALEERGKWDQDTASKIFISFINDTHPLKRHRLQSERYAILQLLDLLLANYRQPIAREHESDPNFLPNFISYFDGEKDPRNLMIVFSILKVPMTEWDIGAHAQDLFEAVFNYFPITFKPPPGDPYGITAQDLKDRLRDCISATSDFAPYAFPALLDKLDSTSMNTKRDVISAISNCITAYEPRTISLYSVTLWDSLKFEILNVQEDDLAEESLQALSLIARQLPLASEGALNAYIKPIVKECNEHLEDAPTKQSQAAGRILRHVAQASPSVADSITKAVLPNLFVLFQASESITKRRGLIDVLNEIVAAIYFVSSQWQTKDEDGIIIDDRATYHALRPFSGDALDALLRAVSHAPKAEVSFRLSALLGLDGLVKIPQLLNDEDSSRIIQACTVIILREPPKGQDEVKEAAIRTLIEAAHHYPVVAADRALPAFVAELPDCPEPGIFAYESALEAFAKLGSESQIADTIIVRLKNKLNAAIHQGAPRSYILSLLMALLYIFANGSLGQEDGTLRITYFWDVAKPLLDQAVGLGTSEQALLTSEASVDLIARICNLIIRPQSTHVQNQAYTSLEALFDSLNASHMTPEAEALNYQGSKLGVIASLHLHAAFQRDVLLPDSTTKLLKTLAGIAAEQSVTPLVQLAALRHISLVFNKFVSSTNLEKTLEETGLDVIALLGSSPSSNTVRLAFAVTKGLLLQGRGKKPSIYMERLLQLLSDPAHGAVASQGFAGLLAPDDTLTKENHCIISGLHKQRTFSQCIAAISQAVQSADEKQNHLVALSGVLRWLPYGVIQPALGTITPLLLQSLDLGGAPYAHVNAAALNTLESVLLFDAASLNEHVSSLVSRLTNGMNASVHDPAVRKGSIRCLTLVPTQMKREAVLPFRRQVVKKLLVCLDDKKRSVRSEAVRCRSTWLGLDQEDEEEEE